MDIDAVAANDNRPDTVIIVLDQPLKRGETSIESLTLRRTNLAGLAGLSLLNLAQMNVDEVRKLLPRITLEGLIEHEVDALDLADTMQIAMELGQFLTTMGDDGADDMPAGARPSLVRVPLDVPIVRGDTRLEAITLRRPDTGAVRGLSLAKLGQLYVDELVAVLPRITLECLTVEEAGTLDMADGMKIGGKIGDFLLSKRMMAA